MESEATVSLTVQAVLSWRCLWESLWILNQYYTWHIYNFQGKKSYCTEGCVQTNSFSYICLPLFQLFFFRSLWKHTEGAAGGGPKGHSVKWTQLWPPRHPLKQPIRSLLRRHIRDSNWLVGRKCGRWGFEWREERREWGGGGGGCGRRGSGVTPPQCTLSNPLPRTGQEISRTKVSCHLHLTGLLERKLLSADWQTGQILEGGLLL